MFRGIKILLFAPLFLFLSCHNASQSGPPEAKKESAPFVEDKRLEGLVRAPEFPALEWLNTDKPLSLEAFKGKIVLLDFWTFCCINCMHVIPDLKKLEAKYPEELVVIGVHSAKFANEKGTESIRQAIMRYEIHHPVINDKDMEVWNLYGVHSWPTLVLINPSGRVIGVQSGEGIFNIFDDIIGRAVKYFDSKKELKRSPLNLALEEAKKLNTLLSFPGKIKADAAHNRLVITDSNHNRILITDPNGTVLEKIGEGNIGSADGAFETAQFNHPQGTFVDGNFLYIADTENHLIRRADLSARKVETILGTGKQAPGYGMAGRGRELALSSPWDLLIHQGVLYIAMAGTHQIYAADLKTLEAKPYAGSGQEARIDGPLQKAALAQPSGIATDGQKLYFADSEGSSVRSADLSPNGKVETIIGEDLFEFGDIDGDIRTARLQHALGVEYEKGLLYVADTYNSKIKIIDPSKKTSTTLAGTGKHGKLDGALREAEFFEPGGLAILGDLIYVADTNNHEIRILDRKISQVTTLVLKNLEKFSAPPAKKFRGRIFNLPSQILGEGTGEIALDFKLPEGYKWNKEAPSHIEWKASDEKIVKFTKDFKQLDPAKISFPLKVSYEAATGKTDLIFDAAVYYCREKSSICLFDELRVTLPVQVEKKGPDNLSVPIQVEAKV